SLKGGGPFGSLLAARDREQEGTLKENETMKSPRFVQPVVLLLLSTAAFAQSGAQGSSVAPVLSEAQKSFATMKSLAGEWEGPVTTDMSEAMKAKMGADKLNPMH